MVVGGVLEPTTYSPLEGTLSKCNVQGFLSCCGGGTLSSFGR